MVDAKPQIAVVMGVSGSGKTSVGRHLATALGWTFAEGDDFHPPANVAKMAGGTPLTDEDRWPWLDAIGRWIATETTEDRSAVVTCSALKRSYRDRLRLAWPDLRLIYLRVERADLHRRLAARLEHFFPEKLLDSQLQTLEPPQADEQPIVVSGNVDSIVRYLVPLLRAPRGLAVGERRPQAVTGGGPMVDSKAFVRRIVEAYQSRTLEGLDALLTDDVVLVRDEEKAHGRAEFKAVLARLHQAFPDLQYSIEDTIDAGDKLVLRWQARGTHQGEYLGASPTGRPVSYTGITIYELRGDRIARVWVCADLLTLLRRMREARMGAASEAHV
jgi:gluconokinase